MARKAPYEAPRGVRDPMITHTIRLGRIQSMPRGTEAVVQDVRGRLYRGPVESVRIDRELSRAKAPSNLVASIGGEDVEVQAIASVQTAATFDAEQAKHLRR